MKAKTTLDVALGYLAQHPDRFIFPIRKGRKYPPLIKDNLAQASNDPEQIKKWHSQNLGCNWGLSHQKSGVLVADIDKNKAKGKRGQGTFDGLDLVYGWPETEITTTPTGGEHRIHKGEHITAFGVHGFGLDIDSPNYTLIPGCTLDKGGKYVSNGLDSVAAPQWMYDVIDTAKNKSRATRSEGFDDPIEVAVFKQMLDATPYKGGPPTLDNRSDDQEGWFNFMAAVHEASGGDNGEYRDLFIDWCLGDPEARETWTAETIIPRWESLNAKRAGGITRASWEKVLLFFKCDDLVSASQGGDIPTDDFAEEPPEVPIEPMGDMEFEYGDRLQINVTSIGSDLPKIARKVQKLFITAALKPDAKAADQVFDREGNLVHLSRNRLEPDTEENFDKNYHVENELLVKSAEQEWFADTLERKFQFYKVGKKKGDSGQSKPKPIPVGAPKPLVNRMFAIRQDWKYPKIKGTVETPTLRLDGTILDEPGYDKKSGLYYDPGTMTFPSIAEYPTFAQRMAALDILKEVYGDFPFADEDGIKDLSLAVALSMPLTGIMRRSLPTAPMFGIDATQANTGKTQLAQVAGIIMTGRETAARVFPTEEYQRKNELAAAFEAGDAMMLYDNIDGDKQSVEGDALCAALTSEMIQCRRLGGNSADDQIKARTNSLISATGNKLTFKGDMSKDRALLCTLRTDKKLADRKFAHWPLSEYVIRRRPTLVAACLTILRGHIVDKCREPGGFFRFPEWRSMVADALVGLGLPDPVRSTERVKADDPQEEAQREVMRDWAQYLGEADVTTSQALPSVRQAIADARGLPDVKKLSTESAVTYLKGMVGIPLLGYRLTRWTDGHTKAIHWQARCVDEGSRVEVASPPTAAEAEREFGFADAADGFDDLM